MGVDQVTINPINVTGRDTFDSTYDSTYSCPECIISNNFMKTIMLMFTSRTIGDFRNVFKISCIHVLS